MILLNQQPTKKHKISLIALGSNLGNSYKYITSAIEAIDNNNKIILLKKSKIHITKPIGNIKQNNYLNAIIKISTLLNPLDLLKYLNKIELLHGRKREIKWGPRTLDLDILDYQNIILNTPMLTLPHPGIYNRKFLQTIWNEIEAKYITANNFIL